jgi:hypothetical protein
MSKSTLTILALLFLPIILVAQNSGPSIGIILGTPTGFTGKYVFARSSAIAANVGWSLVGNQSFYAGADYQFLFPQTLRWTDEWEGTSHQVNGLCPYFGIGGRFFLAEDPNNHNTDINVGVRLGGGLEWAFNRFALFLEIYPVVNIIPSTDFDLEGGLGFRFYFGR